MEDRPYQAAALSAIRKDYDAGVRHQLLSMATGTGKTIVFSKLYNAIQDKLPGQMLILAHREELIDQAIEKIRVVNPTLKVDKEKAEHRADPSTADVIVASVATLGRKGTSRLDAYNWERIDKYITDEAHHSIASSYTNIYNSAGILTNPGDRLLLGVTATPQRGDGRALAQIYKKVVFVYSIRQAIEDGWLVDVRGVRVNTRTNLDNVKTVGGDFAQDMLAEEVNTPERNQLVAKAWLDHAEGRPTIAFTVDIQHAKDLAAMFRHYGVKAEAVWGDDPNRKNKLEAHKAGEFDILTNCGVLTEGYDDWHVSCIVLARPTKSAPLFTQMVGRGTRLQDNTGNLSAILTACPEACIKKDCIVVDVVDSTSKHSLITLPTLLGMSRSLNLKGGSMVKAIHAIEDAQKKHQSIDFSQLKDITQLETFIKEADLFEVRFPAEVEQNSQLTWHEAPDGGFVLLLPNKEKVTLKQNILDKWEIQGIISGRKYQGIRESVEDAFVAADGLINDKAAEHLKILNRKATWHVLPPTEAQLRTLGRFFKGKPLPPHLTRGQASNLIGSCLAKKA